MAKSYSTVVVKTLEKMYSENQMKTPIIAMAMKAWNGTFGAKARFLAGPGQGKGKYELNRILRIKPKDADTTATIGDQIIKRINNAQKMDWETVDTIISIKKDFLVYVEEGDIANFSANPGDFVSGIEQAGKIIAISQEEQAIHNIIHDAKVKKVSIGDQSAADLEVLGEKMFDQIALIETNVSQLVDKFIAGADVSTFVSPYVAKALAAYKGTAFNVDSSKYANDIVPNFVLSESKGYEDPHFDKFEVNQGGKAERVLAIIMKEDAYFDSGLVAKMVPLDTKLLDITLQGHSYWGASSVVDPSRIVVITGEIKTDKVELVTA